MQNLTPSFEQGESLPFISRKPSLWGIIDVPCTHWAMFKCNPPLVTVVAHEVEWLPQYSITSNQLSITKEVSLVYLVTFYEICSIWEILVWEAHKCLGMKGKGHWRPWKLGLIDVQTYLVMQVPTIPTTKNQGKHKTCISDSFFPFPISLLGLT